MVSYSRTSLLAARYPASSASFLAVSSDSSFSIRSADGRGAAPPQLFQFPGGRLKNDDPALMTPQEFFFVLGMAVLFIQRLSCGRYRCASSQGTVRRSGSPSLLRRCGRCPAARSWQQGGFPVPHSSQSHAPSGSS